MDNLQDLEKIVNKEVFNMYGMVDGTQGRLKYFAKKLHLSKEELTGAGELELSAISLMIMYRHLDQKARMKAMEIIRSVPNQKLQRKLVMKVVDTTFVNPSWGAWSKTTKELEEDLKFNEFISTYANGIGVTTLSATVLWEYTRNGLKFRKMGPKSTATLVVAVMLYINEKALDANKDELLSRKVTQQTIDKPRTSSLF